MIEINNIKGAIFDADGTLFDSMWMWYRAESDYIRSFETESDSDTVEILRPKSFLDVAEYLKSEYDVVKSVQEMTNEINAMMEDFYFNKVLLKSGVIPVLKALKARGVKMCVATATDRYLIEPPLRNAGILGYFGRIFTCGEERTSKKNPDIFIRASEFLGTDISETLVIEDAVHAIRSAKKAGFPVIGVYDQTADPYRDEIKGLCDYYYVTLDEMLSIL